MSDYNHVDVNGTLIWYYYICKREVWLMAHNIQPEQDDANIDLGRFLQGQVYQRTKKEISIGNMRLDLIKRDQGQLVIGEVKKSSKYEHSARMQLAFYLYELSLAGIKATGELLFPLEKKKVQVVLNDDLISEIERAKKDIMLLIYKEIPPEPRKIPFCRNCAYRELCWA